MWTRRLSRVGAAAANTAGSSTCASGIFLKGAFSACVSAMHCATAPNAAAAATASSPDPVAPVARRRRGLALAQRRHFVRAIFGKAAGTVADTPGGLRAHRRKLRARVRAETLSGPDVVIRSEGSETPEPLKEGERAALGFFSERRLWSKKARRAAASKSHQLQQAQARAVQKTADVARAAVTPAPFDPTAPLPKADAVTGGFVMEPSTAAAKNAMPAATPPPRRPVGPRLGEDLDVDLAVLDRLNAALRLPMYANMPAQRDALAIAEANLDTLPPLLIARLAAHKWARGVLPSALHTKLRHALFTRCGDMSGAELAVAMAVWSRNEQHATDSGMLQKLGRLLAFHIREVDQADQIVTVWRALVRTRVVPSAAFLKVLSRRYGDLLVGEIRLHEEAVAAAVAKARQDAVASAPVDFSATPSDDCEKAAKDDASRRIAKAAERSSLRVRRPENIRLRAMFDALHLQRKLGPDAMDERTVITLVREFATIVERELLSTGVLNPADMTAPEKLLLCGSDALLLERAKEAATRRNREHHLMGRMTAREAADFVRLRRLTVDDVRALFDVIEQYDVQSRRYLRPVCHLLAGLSPALRRGVFFSVVFPFVLKADFHRLDPVLIRVILSVAPGLSKTCDWEDAIRMVQFARFAKKNGFAGLVAPDNAGAADAAAAATPPPCVADVERLAAKITERLEAPRRPPTAHETVEIGRQMHALARSFPSVETQAIRALEHTLKRALLLLQHRFVTARDAETVIELATVSSAKLSPECRAAMEEFKSLRSKLAAEAASRKGKGSSKKAEDVAPGSTAPAAEKETAASTVSQFSPHSLDDVAAAELGASGRTVLPGPGAVCRQILALNARHAFTELPSAEAKHDLEALKWAVAKKHPRSLLRALDAIEACFPHTLQVQIVSGVGEVLTARLAVPVAEATTGGAAPARASRFAAVFSEGAPKFENAAEFRDFVNLLWRTAPQAVKHQPSVWRYVEWQAQKFGDQDLVTKAQKVRAVFELRRR